MKKGNQANQDFHAKTKSGISHATSNIKNLTRLQVALSAGLFDKAKQIKLVGLGGVEFGFEKYLEFIGIDFKGISYEYNTKFQELALKNAPANVEVRKGSIYNYKYEGNEDIIWFDLMHYVTTASVNELLAYIDTNPFKHSFTFAFTFGTRKPRNGGNLCTHYQKMFPKYKKTGIVDQVAIHIEKSGSVHVKSAKIIPYKNTDVSPSVTQMCLYILQIEKA